MSTQCIFLLIRYSIDPTFCGTCGIFVCGPLQFKSQFKAFEVAAAEKSGLILSDWLIRVRASRSLINRWSQLSLLYQENSMCLLKDFARFRQSILFSSSIIKSKGCSDRRVRAAQPQQEFSGVLHPGCKSTKHKYGGIPP